jgi:hypothetical protein
MAHPTNYGIRETWSSEDIGQQKSFSHAYSTLLLDPHLQQLTKAFGLTVCKNKLKLTQSFSLFDTPELYLRELVESRNPLEHLELALHYQPHQQKFFKPVVSKALDIFRKTARIAFVKSFKISMDDTQVHAEALATTLPFFNSLSVLEIVSNDLCDSDFHVLVASIESISQLTTLKLSAGKLELSSAKIIGVVAKRNSQLTNLSLRGCERLSDEGVSIICEELEEHPCLSSLTLSFMRLRQCSNSITNLVSSLPSLITLDLCENYFDEEAVTYILSGLKEHRSCESLAISHVGSNFSDLRDFSEGLVQCSSLRYLFLNRLPSAAMKNVSQNLNSSNLTALEFGVSTEDPIPIEFAKLIENNASLRSLLLHEVKVEKSFCHHLANSLRTNTTLTSIVWRAVEPLLCTDEVSELCEALKMNTSVTSLSLCVGLTNESIKSIAAMVEQNGTLEFLNVSLNNYGAQGTDCLLKSLKKNQSLVFLGFDCNCPADHRHLADALDSSDSLIGIHCKFHGTDHLQIPKFLPTFEINQKRFLEEIKFCLFRSIVQDGMLENGVVTLILQLARWDISKHFSTNAS